MSGSSVALSLLWFALIVAAIPVVLWLLKRTPLAMGGAAQTARVVSSTALGTQQRLVTVEVGQGEDRRWLVLGVSPGSITTLHTLPPQPLPEACAPTAPAAFAALLQKVSRRDPPSGA
ncbi:FliO/MopB family protein [Caldimonas tepidiphila]|uniref:FliO/MopB family protein n=1 Tax=Caldimonas tepidiphila TaxID=2315841 RepID=UPI000E5AEA47|nr:flagellar biosynthetic protein FliO [Caldimonas tepidiphila]